MIERTGDRVTLGISYDDTREMARRLLRLKEGLADIHVQYTGVAGVEFDWDLDELDYSELLTEAAEVLARAADSWINARSKVVDRRPCHVRSATG